MESNIKQLLQYNAEKKSASVSYLLFFFFYFFGAHQFYLGEKKKGFIRLVVNFAFIISGIIFVSHSINSKEAIGYALILLIFACLMLFYLIYDLVTLNKKIKETNLAIINRLSK